ncbi:hypothetical protein [Vibrio phage S4-7]|nr:hypothetical protein [Vibrio phage S4-7]
MNEQLQTALTQIIDKTMTGVDQSVDFLSEQIPDVLSQLLLWYGVSNMIYALVGIVVLYACYRIVKKPKGTNETWLWEWSEYKESHRTTDYAPFLFLLILPIIIGLALLGNIMYALQIFIAPKIWLIEYAASLAK